jgi:hypothetical protein
VTRKTPIYPGECDPVFLAAGNGSRSDSGSGSGSDCGAMAVDVSIWAPVLIVGVR